MRTSGQGGEGSGMMETGGRLNFHLSVGSYLDYYPRELPAQLTGLCIHIDYLFPLNLTYQTPPSLGTVIIQKKSCSPVFFWSGVTEFSQKLIKVGTIWAFQHKKTFTSSFIQSQSYMHPLFIYIFPSQKGQKVKTSETIKDGRKKNCTKEMQECLRVQKNTKVRKSEFKGQRGVVQIEESLKKKKLLLV